MSGTSSPGAGGGPRSRSSSACSTSSDAEDAEDYRRGGYHPVKLGDTFKGGRYLVVKKLGWGHFSTVWLVKDLELSGKRGGGGECESRDVFGALKIQKSATHYREAAMDEIKILKQIKDKDPDGKMPVAHLLDWFEHLGPNGKHVCIVMESLGDNLLTLVKLYDYRGIPMEVVKMVARNTLEALNFLHSELQIIHTDLKPENVLLMGKVPKSLKMVKKKKGKSRRKKESGKAAQKEGGSHHPQQPVAYVPQEGKIAKALASGAPLTKNQKKKLKKKQKKMAATMAQNGAPEGSNGAAKAEKAAHKAATATNGKHGAPSNGNGSRKAALEDELMRMEVRSLSLSEVAASLPKECKVIDLGNACWTYKKFTSDIQTRQYRCPEVILGASYSTPADIWSLACIIFELVTGDYLFEPKTGKEYSRDEDHLALFQEALGKIPKRIALKGKYARDFFNRNGELKHIKKLEFWPLADVFADKYDLEPEEAECMASFLHLMLDYDPEKRATAHECLQHPWLAQGKR